MSANRLSLKMLGSDILCKIFEYDNSPKIAYSNCVIGGVWSSVWRYWRNTAEECEIPHVCVAMDWLFESWGVHKYDNPNYDPSTDPNPPLKFFVNQYFPSDISIVENEIIDNKVYNVDVYMNHHSVLRCTVVDFEFYNTEYQQAQEDQDSMFYNLMDVYVDDERRMVLLIEFGW
jgi:hypothetical protein